MVGMMDEKKLAMYKAKLKSRTENNKIRNREIIRRRVEKNRLNKVKFTPPVPKVVVKPVSKVETIERNIVPVVEKIDKNKEFVFIIPSYNNESNYLKNLDSVLNQTYQNWRVVYVDDCSNDNTYDLVSKYIVDKNVDNKVKILKTDKNRGPAYSRHIAFKECQDDEICCLLDGDDWLYDNNVLEKLNRLYVDNDLLVSYGGTYEYKNGKLNNREKTIVPFPEDVIKGKTYRQHPWSVYHLRTGKAELFKSIPEDYLKDEEGEWIKCCTDMAVMWWVLELCDGKFMVNNFATYVYNIDNTNKYITSYYRRKEDKSWEMYREKIMKQLMDYNHKKYVVSDDQIKFNKYLEDNKIKQICISKSLSGFDRIKKIYGLSDYNPNSNQPALFFGVYDLKELENISKYSGKKYIMFGGSDADDRIEISKKVLLQFNTIKNCEVIAISQDIQNRLDKYSIKSTLINLDLMIYELFKPRDVKGNKIYIYDGQGNITNEKNIVYGRKYINEIMKKLPEYEYILSSKLNQIQYEKMADIYAECFIGLRLTDYDGNANTVKEFEAMGIPIVHNQSEYGLKWENVDDIVKYIDKNDISIIINSYNPDKKDLLRSVNGCLNQKNVNVSLIIVTIENDNTIKYINELNNENIKLVICSKNKHPGKGAKGIYYQLNKGLKQVNTRFFSYFSSNDIIYPNKSYDEIKKIKDDNSIFCFSRFVSVFPKTNKKITFDYAKEKMNFNNLLQSNFINDCATIDLDKIGNMLEFNYEKYGNTSYWHLWLYLIKKHGVKCMSFNDNITWEYIRDENKSQAIERSKNKLEKEIYYNQKEFMISEFNNKIIPNSIYKYINYNFKWKFYNNHNNCEITLFIIDDKVDINQFNFNYTFEIITNQIPILNLINKLSNKNLFRFVYNKDISLKNINDLKYNKNNTLFILSNKKLLNFSNIYWYDCPSILDTSIRYRNNLRVKEFDKNIKYPNKTDIIFFGFYKQREVEILKDLDDCNVYIIFGGTDTWDIRSYSKKNLKYLKDNKNKNITYLSISNFINNDLFKYKINYIPIYFSYLGKTCNSQDIFLNKQNNYIDKSYIYVYDNIGTFDVYNKELIDNIISYFGEDLFIRSSKLNVKYTEMPGLLSKCFLGIRLTKHDGNANIVQELGFMGIKCIHNSFFYNSIPFIENNEEIIKQIKNEIKNKNKNNYNLVSEICYNDNKLSNFSITDIKTSINRIVDIILLTENDTEESFCNCLKSILFQHLVKTNVMVISYENDISKNYVNKYFKEYCNLKYISIKRKENVSNKNNLLIESLKFLENEYFCIVNVNHIFYKNKINIELEALENNTDKIMCVSNYDYKEDKMNLINVELSPENLSICNLMRKIVYFKYIKNINYKKNETLEYNLFSSILHYDSNNIVKINKSLYINNKIYKNKINYNILNYKKKKMYYIYSSVNNIFERSTGDCINEKNNILYLSKYYDIYYNCNLIDVKFLDNYKVNSNIEIPKNEYDIYYIRNNIDIYNYVKKYDKEILWFCSPYMEEAYNNNTILFLTKTWYDLISYDKFNNWGIIYNNKNITNIKKKFLLEQKLSYDKSISDDTQKYTNLKIKLKKKYVIGIFGAIRPTCFPLHLFNIISYLDKDIISNLVVIFFTQNNNYSNFIYEFIKKINLKIDILFSSFDYSEREKYYKLCDLVSYNQLDDQSIWAGSGKVLEPIFFYIPIISIRTLQREYELGKDYPLFYKVNLFDNIKFIDQENYLVEIINYKYLPQELIEIKKCAENISKVFTNSSYKNYIKDYLEDIDLSNFSVYNYI